MKTQKRGQNRKNSISGRIREEVRKFLSVALSVSIVAVGMPTVPAFAAVTNEDDDVQEFTLTSEDLKESLKDALIKGNTVSEDKYVFSGAAQEDYEDIFFGADVFELDPEIEDDKDGKLKLKVFARLSADHDLDSLEASGEDEIIFLLLNHTKKEETARIYIDNYATDLITVVPKSEVLLEAVDEEPAEEVDEEAEITETAIPVTEGTGAGGAGGGSSSYSTDDGLSYEEVSADGSESSDDADSASEDAASDEGTADEGGAEDESSGREHASAGDDEGSDDAGSESSESGNADSSDNEGSGSKSGSESSGSSDGEESGSDSSDNSSGSSDSGSSESSNSSSGSSGSSSESSDGGSGSSNSGSSESSDGGSKGSDSSSASSGSSSGNSEGRSGSAVASVSMHEVGLLAAPMGDIVIEIDGDEVVATMVDEDENVIDSEVMIASTSDADADDEDDDDTSSDGYIDIEGEVYQAVFSGKKNSAVAFVTTLEKIGMEEGVALEASVFTASDEGISVEVIAPAGALPDEAELSVTRYMNDSVEFAAAAEAIGHGADDTNMAALDISFFDADGEEIEPSDEVQVIIDVSDILPENVDASTLKVTHLEDRSFLFGLFKWVKSVVVADEDEGYIDEDNAVIEFSVDSFSVFTVEWNDGTGATIEVHVYNINGTSINETLDEDSNLIAELTPGTINISELVDHLQNNSTLVTEYTYQYATVIYETDLGGPGYSSDTVGSSENSVVSVSKNNTTYTVILTNGTETTITDPALIKINLYYSAPTITLDIADNSSPYDDIVEFIVISEYFQHEDEGTTTYSWALSNDSAGTLTHETLTDTATFSWDTETVKAGDTVTVTVTKTVTYGDEQTETASDTYTLVYGADPITFTVTLDGVPQANAHVAIVDENGNTISTGTTDESGQVTLYTIDGGTYTVGVTYCVADTSGIGGGSTTRYTAEGTVTLSDDGAEATGDTTLALANPIVSGPGNDTSGMSGGGSEPYYYEHIDVKVAAAGTEETQVNFSDLDAVYVYDKYGNLIYVSEDLERNPETGDYNCLFDINGSEDQHSIVVSSEDTIVIVYEVVDDNGNYSTYTASYTGGGTYPSGEYYPYTAVNAFQLYNYINSTELTEEQFLAMVEDGTLIGSGIDIGGMGYTEVADCLCDTRTTTGQAGLDFVIYVTEIEDIFGQYVFRVAKTLEDAPSTITESAIEVFTFELQDVSSVVDGSTYTEGIWTTTGEDPETGYTTADSWTQDGGNWNAVVDFGDALTYEAQDGTYFYYFVISELDAQTAITDQQYYGIKVTVTYSASTGVAEIVASYCDLTKSDDTTYNRVSTWRELAAQTYSDEESDEGYTYFAIPFTNTYSATGIELAKADGSGNSLEGAVFTLSSDDDETSELYFRKSESDEGGIVYALVSDEYAEDDDVSIYIVVTGESVSILNIAAGTYILTETTAPDGYYLLPGRIRFSIDNNGNILEVSMIDSAGNSIENMSDYWSTEGGVLTIKNYPGNGLLPRTGGPGTLPFRMAGMLMSVSALYLLFMTWRRRKLSADE